MASRVKGKCHFRLTEIACILRHVTAQEIIEARMIELWGKRNVTRLAEESGVDRASVSKILGYTRGLGADVAAKLAIPLGLELSELLPPKAERVTLAYLAARLEDIADAGARTRVALLESLASIDVRLSRIEALLGLQDGRDSEAQ